MSKKQSNPKPSNYGPYKITPPTGGGPFPMWRVVGPSLELASTSEANVRLRASEANACYQQGVKSCSGAFAVLRELVDYAGDSHALPELRKIADKARAALALLESPQ